MNYTTLLLTVLAVVLAAVAKIATAAELLEPLYPAKIQDEGGDIARARLDDLARDRSIDVEYRAAETEYRAEFRADQLRGSIETVGGEEFRAAKSASLFDEDGAEARRADFRARMDGDMGENLFGVPLPP